MSSTENPNYQLQKEEIDVWLCHSDTVQDRVDYFKSLLSSNEMTRAGRFKFDIHRSRFIISHGFMRVVLAKYLLINPAAIQYQTGEKGKPCLSESNGQAIRALKFNLSHTQDVALLAVTQDAEIGVDIECIDRKTSWQGICKRFFTQPEQQALFSLATVAQQEMAFYELWTRKEAYMKVLGTGLSLSPTEFTLTVPPEHPALIKHHSKKHQAYTQVEFSRIELPESLDHYCATLALASSIRKCHFYQYT